MFQLKSQLDCPNSFLLQQQQQQQQLFQPDLTNNNLGPHADEREKAQWGWNWLERWMSSQPYQARHAGHQEASYMTLPTTTTTTTTDEMSEKMVEMDMIAHLGLNRDSIDSGPYPTMQRQPSSNNVPSYMAPTQSAKAKVRGQGPAVKQHGPYVPQWNPSTRRGSVAESGFDSSSSGGGTITYQAPRSPSPKSNGTRPQARRSTGYSPTSNGVDDWPLGGHAWRHDFG